MLYEYWITTFFKFSYWTKRARSSVQIVNFIGAEWNDASTTLDWQKKSTVILCWGHRRYKLFIGSAKSSIKRCSSFLYFIWKAFKRGYIARTSIFVSVLRCSKNTTDRMQLCTSVLIQLISLINIAPARYYLANWPIFGFSRYISAANSWSRLWQGTKKIRK